MLDPNNQYDAIVLNRIANLEERVKDLTIAYQKFATMTQVQQIYTGLVTEVAHLRGVVSSLENRIKILEDLPPID